MALKSAIDKGSAVVMQRKPIDPSFLLPLVPVGENSALTAKAIWEIERIWSPASIKARLNELAQARVDRTKAGAHRAERDDVLLSDARVSKSETKI